MKKFKTIIPLLLLLFISACTTTETITVEGEPGTVIYSPYRTELGKIQSNGKTKINLSSDAYYGYLYTYNSQDDIWVPFALETKRNSHSGTKAVLGLGYTLETVGIATMIPGVIMICAAGDDGDVQTTGLILTGAGAGMALAGVGCLPAGNRLKQLSYQYNFSYQKNQVTNSDLKFTKFTPPTENEVQKTDFINSKSSSSNTSDIKSTRPKAVTSDNSANQERIDTEASSKVSRSRKDAAKLAEGIYSGSGSLIINKKNVETINNIEVKVIYMEKGTVKVEITEDGEQFFDSDEIYDVKIEKNGDLILTHKKIPTATIVISKNNLKYENPNVNLDGEKYTFIISAAKKRGNN